MGDLYSEVIVKRRENTKIFIRKTLVLALGIGLIMVMFWAGGALLVPLMAVAGYILYIIMNRFNVEYEYIYVNGDLEIDKIMGRAKRKKLYNFDLEKVEIVAPLGSHRLDQYNRNANYKTLDYSSGNPKVTPYVMVTHKGTDLVKVLFEPNEKMLNDMKMTSPRKINMD